MEDCIKSINDNINSVEGNLKADLKNEQDLRLKDNLELDQLRKSTLVDQENLRNMISQEAKDRNE